MAADRRRPLRRAPRRAPEGLGSTRVLSAARQSKGMRKRPSTTSELIDWIAALLSHGVDEEIPRHKELPFLGMLLKREQDMAQRSSGSSPSARRSADGGESSCASRSSASSSSRCGCGVHGGAHRVDGADGALPAAWSSQPDRLLPRGARAVGEVRGPIRPYDQVFARRFRPAALCPEAVEASCSSGSRARRCSAAHPRDAGALEQLPLESSASCSRSGCASRTSATTAAIAGSARAAPHRSATAAMHPAGCAWAAGGGTGRHPDRHARRVPRLPHRPRPRYPRTSPSR